MTGLFKSPKPPPPPPVQDLIVPETPMPVDPTQAGARRADDRRRRAGSSIAQNRALGGGSTKLGASDQSPTR